MLLILKEMQKKEIVVNENSNLFHAFSIGHKDHPYLFIFYLFYGALFYEPYEKCWLQKCL